MEVGSWPSSVVAEGEELWPGQLYFLLLLLESYSHSPLSLPDLCLFAATASTTPRPIPAYLAFLFDLSMINVVQNDVLLFFSSSFEEERNSSFVIGYLCTRMILALEPKDRLSVRKNYYSAGTQRAYAPHSFHYPYTIRRTHHDIKIRINQGNRKKESNTKLSLSSIAVPVNIKRRGNENKLFLWFNKLPFVYD